MCMSGDLQKPETKKINCIMQPQASPKNHTVLKSTEIGSWLKEGVETINTLYVKFERIQQHNFNKWLNAVFFNFYK